MSRAEAEQAAVDAFSSFHAEQRPLDLILTEHPVLLTSVADPTLMPKPRLASTACRSCCGVLLSRVSPLGTHALFEGAVPLGHWTQRCREMAGRR